MASVRGLDFVQLGLLLIPNTVSAINFNCKVEKVPNPEGDRVVITLNVRDSEYGPLVLL